MIRFNRLLSSYSFLIFIGSFLLNACVAPADLQSAGDQFTSTAIIDQPTDSDLPEAPRSTAITAFVSPSLPPVEMKPSPTIMRPPVLESEEPTPSFRVKTKLEATDPSKVTLAAGQPQLVEFFAFW